MLATKVKKRHSSLGNSIDALNQAPMPNCACVAETSVSGTSCVREDFPVTGSEIIFGALIREAMPAHRLLAALEVSAVA